jgi:hypothetical protein
VTDPHLRDEALAARDADVIGPEVDVDGTRAELVRDGEEMEARARARRRAGLVRCRDGWTRVSEKTEKATKEGRS